LPEKIKINLKLLKRINKRDLRVISLIMIPAIVFLFSYFFLFKIIRFSLVISIISFIIIYFWKFFKEVFSASFVGVISFIIIIILFFITFVLLIKYNSGDIDWGVDVIEMFSLDKYIKK